MIPLVNASLTEIKGGGFTEDDNRPAGADTPRWSGEVEAYLEEQMKSEVANGRLDAVSLSRLVVPLEQGELAQRGDTVTYTFADESRSRTIRDIEQYRFFGTVVLWMFDE